MSQKIPERPPGSPRYAINRALADLTRHPNGKQLVADKASFFKSYDLSAEETSALLENKWGRLLELGVLPNLVYRYYSLHGLKPETFSTEVAGN